MYTPQQELAIYKRMYSWYRLPGFVLLILEWLEYAHTNKGFCHFLTTQWRNEGAYFLPHLDTLIQLRIDQLRPMNKGFWYRPGAIAPRRRLLKQAIEVLERELELKQAVHAVSIS